MKIGYGSAPSVTFRLTRKDTLKEKSFVLIVQQKNQITFNIFHFNELYDVILSFM